MPKLFLAALFTCLVGLAVLTAAPAGAQGADAINDLLRGGSGAATVPPREQPASPRPAQEGNSLSPPQIGKDAEGSPRIVYFGQAAADGRKARITLVFRGSTVTGDIRIDSVCEPNVHLAGATLTFRGTLSGDWESKAARIVGDWDGTEQVCGSETRNHGTLEFFLKEDGYFDPVLHLRITGERGRYGWNFAPAGRVVVPAPTAGAYVLPTDAEDPVIPGASAGKDPGGDGTDDTDDTGDRDGKRRIPWSEPIDPALVSGFDLLPRTLSLKPGESAPLPVVIALMNDPGGARDREVEEGLSWDLPEGLEIVSGRLALSPFVKDEDELSYTVAVTLGPLRETLRGTVRVVRDAPLGSIRGMVFFEYNPHLTNPDPSLASPLRSTVELIPEGRTRAETRRVTAGPDGLYRFDSIPAGRYSVLVRDVVPPDFPPGYELDRAVAWKHWQSVEVGRAANDEDAPVWDLEDIWVRVRVHKPPPMDGHVYGRVLYKGRGVEGVTVMAHNVKDSDQKAEAVSRADGTYQVMIDDLPSGQYWIQAERYDQTRRPYIAGPNDLLDIRTNRLEDPILVHSPLSDPRGLQLDIEVDTRAAIFGAPADPGPVELPFDN